MKQKYEILKSGPYIVGDDGGHLYPIRAMRDIKLIDGRTILSGTIGGYIEKEENLSMLGECWVDVGSQVEGKATVTGNALITKTSIIKERAFIMGCVIVYNSIIKGTAIVDGSSTILSSSIDNKTYIKAGSSTILSSTIDNKTYIKDAKIENSYIGNSMIKTSSIKNSTLSNTYIVDCDFTRVCLSAKFRFEKCNICNFMLDKDVWNKSLSLYPKAEYDKYMLKVSKTDINNSNDILFYPIIKNHKLIGLLSFYTKKDLLSYNNSKKTFQEIGDMILKLASKLPEGKEKTFITHLSLHTEEIIDSYKNFFYPYLCDKKDLYKKILFFVYGVLLEAIHSPEEKDWKSFFEDVFNAFQVDLKTGEICSKSDLMFSTKNNFLAKEIFPLIPSNQPAIAGIFPNFFTKAITVPHHY